jgi:hypothetical protein
MRLRLMWKRYCTKKNYASSAQCSCVIHCQQHPYPFHIFLPPSPCHTLQRLDYTSIIFTIYNAEFQFYSHFFFPLLETRWLFKANLLPQMLLSSNVVVSRRFAAGISASSPSIRSSPLLEVSSSSEAPRSLEPALF